VEIRDVEEVEAALSGRDVSCSVDKTGGSELVADAPSPEALVADAEERRQSVLAIRSALEQLSERERRILHKRRLAEDPATLASLGCELGLSRERVRQIERQAESKVRRAIEAMASM
jgi:RNA polymerase sigma-32 factor